MMLMLIFSNRQGVLVMGQASRQVLCFLSSLLLVSELWEVGRELFPLPHHDCTCECWSGVTWKQIHIQRERSGGYSLIRRICSPVHYQMTSCTQRCSATTISNMIPFSLSQPEVYTFTITPRQPPGLTFLPLRFCSLWMFHGIGTGVIQNVVLELPL